MLIVIKNILSFSLSSFKTKGNLTKHMKSKAHYKKCVELGVVPVPTIVCDENIDKEAIARLAAGGNTEESSDEEDESEGEESEESGSEEQEVAQSLLSLSQRNANRLPGLLPSGRPTTYPYTLTFSTTSASVSVSVTVTSAPMSSQTIASTQETTVVRNELSHRYYFPSNRTAPEELRTTVIQSSKKESPEIEINKSEQDSRNASSQPMDLTTKAAVQSLPAPVPQRARPTDILTPVSEPVLLQTIVQTMERLPIQGREWKPDAEGHVLPAYLKEITFAERSESNKCSYSVTEDGKSVCAICNKVFSKPSQLRLHINIHYFERPFRCESCAVSFRTKGHLTKHERSVSHHNKVDEATFKRIRVNCVY